MSGAIPGNRHPLADIIWRYGLLDAVLPREKFKSPYTSARISPNEQDSKLHDFVESPDIRELRLTTIAKINPTRWRVRFFFEMRKFSRT